MIFLGEASHFTFFHLFISSLSFSEFECRLTVVGCGNVNTFQLNLVSKYPVLARCLIVWKFDIGVNINNLLFTSRHFSSFKKIYFHFSKKKVKQIILSNFEIIFLSGLQTHKTFIGNFLKICLNTKEQKRERERDKEKERRPSMLKRL